MFNFKLVFYLRRTKVLTYIEFIIVSFSEEIIFNEGSKKKRNTFIAPFSKVKNKIYLKVILSFGY